MSADTSMPADGRGRPDRPRAAGRQDWSAWPLYDAAAAGFRGGLIGIETAARAPALVAAPVLSSSPHYDAARRARAAARPPVDHLAERSDGSHLAELRGRRQGSYPPGRPDLLTHLVRGALASGDGAAAGHEACQRYRLEDRAALVRCPVLCLGASADPFVFPDTERSPRVFRTPGWRSPRVAWFR